MYWLAVMEPKVMAWVMVAVDGVELVPQVHAELEAAVEGVEEVLPEEVELVVLRSRRAFSRRREQTHAELEAAVVEGVEEVFPDEVELEEELVA